MSNVATSASRRCWRISRRTGRFIARGNRKTPGIILRLIQRKHDLIRKPGVQEHCMRKHLLALLSLLFTIPATASITGVVINSDGQPIAGAKISIFAPETIEAHWLRLVSQNPTRSALATQTTDSKGTFNFESPKDQKVVDLTIEANGFAPDATRLLADDEAGAIALIAAPMQRGTITAEGKPVSGATIIWLGGNSDVLTKTDADGRYTVPDPSKWANRLIIIHPDHAIVDEARTFRTSPNLNH